MIPLLIREPRTRVATALLRQDTDCWVSWATRTECLSGLHRRKRAGELNAAQHEAATTLEGPVLVIAGAEAVGGTAEQVMPTACALELIHTYSLVHDDLPAMDNDDFRRGVPTNHKVFGEATAILAGDALLTLAFRLVADNARTSSPGALQAVVVDVDIAAAAGHGGMVAGQVADLEAEGRRVGADTVDYIHAHKTGALIRTSLRVGAMLFRFIWTLSRRSCSDKIRRVICSTEAWPLSC